MVAISNVSRNINRPYSPTIFRSCHTYLITTIHYASCIKLLSITSTVPLAMRFIEHGIVSYNSRWICLDSPLRLELRHDHIS